MWCEFQGSRFSVEDLGFRESEEGTTWKAGKVGVGGTSAAVAAVLISGAGREDVAHLTNPIRARAARRHLHPRRDTKIKLSTLYQPLTVSKHSGFEVWG